MHCEKKSNRDYGVLEREMSSYLSLFTIMVHNIIDKINYKCHCNNIVNVSITLIPTGGINFVYTYLNDEARRRSESA